MVRKLTFGIFMMLFGKIILGFVLLSVISVASTDGRLSDTRL